MMSKVICPIVNIILNARNCTFLHMENLSDNMDIVVIHYSVNINGKLKKFKFYISIVFDDYVLFTKDISDENISICSININDSNDSIIGSKALFLIEDIASKVEE